MPSGLLRSSKAIDYLVPTATALLTRGTIFGRFGCQQIYISAHQCKACIFFVFLGMLFSGSRVFLLEFLAVGSARGPSVHYRARLDPSRAPSRCFELSVSLNWLFFWQGVVFRRAEMSRRMQKTTFVLFF